MRSLESELRRRLVLWIAPALVVIGASAVLITSRILDRADHDVARKRADELALAMDDELAEGDDFATAAGEVLSAVEREGGRGLVRAAGDERATKDGLPSPLAGLAPGACAVADGTWIACGARHGRAEAVAATRIDAHRSAVAKLAAWMALVVALALLVAIAAVRAALRRPMRELSALAAWADGLAGVSTEHARAPAASHAEVQRLATAFDTLVDRLLEALARERAQSGHIAHELRTPLAALRADLEMLPAELATTTERMRGDIARLERVIDAILVLSAPPSSSTSRDVVNVADAARAAAPTGVEVHAPDEALVAADPRLVDLALANLLENADKHAGGARAIEVTREGDAVAVSVLDAGAGVPDAELEKMFERYWRGTADGRGSGIGLAFVRAVAERYGGTARARKRHDARGLAVGFTLAPLLGWEAR